MLNISDLPVAIQKHHQLQQASCAVSGFELVAKLHGLIEINSFPLQKDPSNQSKGFGDKDFLESLNIKPLADHYDIKSGMDLIEIETNQDRYPLISLLNFDKFGCPLGYHIYLSLQSNEKLVLIDPAYPVVIVDSKEDLTKVMACNSNQNPYRKKIEILSYTL